MFNALMMLALEATGVVAQRIDSRHSPTRRRSLGAQRHILGETGQGLPG